MFPRLRFTASPAVFLLLAACSTAARPATGAAGDGVANAATAGASGAAAGTGAGSGGTASQAGASGSLAHDDAAVNDAGDVTHDAAAADGGDSGGAAIRLPPENTGLDYQLGDAYAPPTGVEIVARDRTASIAAGLYNICYVNGFQIQPNEEAFWLSDHPELVLRDSAGDPVIDQDWDEMLIDVGTVDKRAAVAEIVAGWIEGCAAKGFDAVEIDNLDTYSRSGGRLSKDDAVATMQLFSAAAHAAGLAIAQKNSAEIVDRRTELGTDFVVAEECNRWSECDVYTAAYGALVFVIEYRRSDFDKGCSEFPQLSIVLRDLNLVGPGNASYVYDGC